MRPLGILLAAAGLLQGCVSPAPWARHSAQGDKAFHRRRYAEAERGFSAALQEAERARPSAASREQVAESLRRLAFLNYVQGRYAEAEDYYRRVLAAVEALSRPDPLETVAALDDLAEAESMQGKQEQVESHGERALGLLEKVRGPSHPELIPRLRSLALLHSARGRYEKAEESYGRALAIARKSGDGDLREAEILSDLALLHQTQGRHKDAEPLHLRSLALREKNLGEGPELADPLDNLALFYEARERYADAEALFKRSLAIQERAYGTKDRRLAPTLESYAELLRRAGRTEEGKALRARVEALRGPRKNTP